MQFSMLLSNTNRSRAYLQGLIQAGFMPKFVVYMDEGSSVLVEQVNDNRPTFKQTLQKFRVEIPEFMLGFDQKEPIIRTLAHHQIPYQVVCSSQVNDPKVVEAISLSPTSDIVFSGPGGQILQSNILNQGKKFLHVHPGWLPDYRGSTVLYYSMLCENAIAASVIYFSEGIDKGPILFQKKYTAVSPHHDVDYMLDPIIRVATLIDFFKSKCVVQIEQTSDLGHTFYIIHPILKHLSKDYQKMGRLL